MIPILLALHILAVVFWVGGMAFAYTILRPAAGGLEPAQRLPLWRRVFASFLPRVGGAIVVILVTGIWMIFSVFGGFATAPLNVNLMMATGILMMLLYLHLVFAPWKRFRMAVDGGDLQAAARNLDRIRRTVAINTALGLLTIVIAVSGGAW
ncbi:MAG: CopD family protein [Rhizobiales bacterium]|nr:CopD family protein [Hyphomicrobiales bacterium]